MVGIHLSASSSSPEPYPMAGALLPITLSSGRRSPPQNLIQLQAHSATSPDSLYLWPHPHTLRLLAVISALQFTWLVVTTNQLPPLSCGQLVHNRATSCINVYLNILQAISPSWVGGSPLSIAVYPLIHVSVYTVSDDLCVYRMLCMSM